MVRQLTLPVNLRDDATFTNFYPGDNNHLVKALKALLSGDGEQFIYLWGAPGVGRSHLLQACCHEFSDRQCSIVYLPLRSEHLTPEILQGMEAMRLVCLDDIDAVLGQPQWEEALLHFYNRARDNGVKLIVSGNDLPPQLPCELADLRSRLSWGLVFQVTGLSDEQKLLALQMHARHRGMHISCEVGQFLLRHLPRNMTELFKVLNKLDHASLVAKKRLTIPFIKRVLE
ncbi:DnaA regulatory inactivator Hda [Candidiatus Paracoxiella cheracis]